MRPRKNNRHLPSCVYLKHGSYYLVRNGRWERLGSDLAHSLAEYALRVSDKEDRGMGALIDDAISQMKVSPSTKKQYLKTGAKLKHIFGRLPPQDVDGGCVAAVKKKYAQTPFYANRLLSLLRLVFAYAVENGIARNNPCIGIRPHKEPSRKRYVSDSEFLAIYGNAGPRLQVIMDLLYLTAQRPIDILNLKRDQIKEDGIYFEQQKTGARILVRWNPELRDAVERAKKLHGNVRALTLLHNRKGKAPDYSTVKIQWDKARRLAGVDCQLRDIRAKALTDAENQGIDPQKIAGHSSPAMTKRYLRLRKTTVAIGPSFGQVIDVGQTGTEKQ